MDFLQHILAHWQEIMAAALIALGAFTGFLAALYALFLLIPGEQPDKTLKVILDFTKRFSRKAVLVLVIVLPTYAVTACAGLPKQDCLSRVAAAEISITEGYKTTTQLYFSEVIDNETANKALASVDYANVLVDSAGNLCKLDEARAADYLEQAQKILMEVAELVEVE